MPSYARRPYTPRSLSRSRGRTLTRTARAARSISSAVSRSAARSASRSSPYVAAAVGAAELGYEAYKAYKSYTKTKTKNKTKKKSYTKIKSDGKPMVRFNTTATYVGKTSKLYPKNYNKYYNLHGSVKINEFGGSVLATATNAVYLCHGIATDEVVQSFWRAIVKELFRQRRDDIKNWSDKIDIGNTSATKQLRIDIRYVNKPSTSADPVVGLLSFEPLPDISYETLSKDLYVFWQTGQGTGSEPKEILSIVMLGQSANVGNTGTYYDVLAKIHMKQVRFSFNIKSSIMVQNRTLAEISKASEDASERDNALDIENVPLIGRQYSRCKSWRNYLDVDVRTGTEAPGNAGTTFAKKLNADSMTGVIQFESSANASSMLKKPPPGYILGFKSDKKLLIQPGTIISDKWTFNTSLSTASFMLKFQHILGNSAVNTTKSARVDFGFIQGVGLEKLLDSMRSSGSPINLAYQVTQTYKCALIYNKHVASNPIVNDTSNVMSYSTDQPT